MKDKSVFYKYLFLVKVVLKWSALEKKVYRVQKIRDDSGGFSKSKS